MAERISKMNVSKPLNQEIDQWALAQWHSWVQ